MAATQLQLETTGSSPQSGRGDHKLEPGTTSGRTLEALVVAHWKDTNGGTSGGQLVAGCGKPSGRFHRAPHRNPAISIRNCPIP